MVAAYSVGEEPGVRLRLRRYLGARLGPLAVFLVFVTTVSAPLAFWVLGRDALQVQAEATAKQVAEVIRGDAQQRPVLWKYDSLKLIAHLRSYEINERIARIDVVDASGSLIESGQEQELAAIASADVIWASAPVQVNNEKVGEVWVAASTEELRHGVLLLAAAFGVLGLGLGGLMYWLPMRAMGRAQDQIEALLRRLAESQAALSSLNENLEHQVEERSSELRQAYRELQEKEKNLREISTRAVGLQEAERRRIARELHDSAGQALTAIRIHLQLMSDLLSARSPDDAKGTKLEDMTRRTTSMVDDTVEEIRRAVNKLGPAVLDDVGLAEAIERAAEDLSETMQLEVQTDLCIDVPLEAAVETTCYRLIQEALTNVARHAEAQRVTIQVRTSGGRLHLEVEDDGNGFDPKGRASGSRGLVGMRERVELLGGHLHLESTPGRGTRIRAEVPVAAP